MLLAMEDTLQCQVGKQGSIHVLLPFGNGNTSRKFFPNKPQPKFVADFFTNHIFYFRFTIEVLEILGEGGKHTTRKVLKLPFQRYITCP